MTEGLWSWSLALGAEAGLWELEHGSGISSLL